MLGGVRKAVVGTAGVGLLALGLVAGPTPVEAAPGPNSACVVTEVPADVFNIEMFDKSPTHGHTNQAVKGSFEYGGRTMPRFGLYYPQADPATDHITPRFEDFGGPSTLGDTPVQTGDDFMFEQAGRCANNNVSFSTSGLGIGYCGRSVGLGTGSVNGQTVIIRWESAASQLIMLDPSALGTVNARPNPPGDTKGSCLDGSAITFTVDGALTNVVA